MAKVQQILHVRKKKCGMTALLLLKWSLSDVKELKSNLPFSAEAAPSNSMEGRSGFAAQTLKSYFTLAPWAL